MKTSQSIWQDRARAATAADPLTANTHADVAIVGAGIAGLSTALSLLREGREVLLLEKDAVGAGQTALSSAHLSSAFDDRYYKVADWHGEDAAAAVAASHAKAIELVEHRVNSHGIECQFQRLDGCLVAAPSTPVDSLRREYAAALRAGLDVEYLPTCYDGLEQFGTAVRFARQARLDPLAYLRGLAAAARGLGAKTVRAEVVEVEGGEQPVALTTRGDRIQANAIVVATDTPFHERFALHTKQAAYRTYVIAAKLHADQFPDVLLWDTADPYHYVRRVDGTESGDVLVLIGGADHKVGQTPREDPFEDLVAWASGRFGWLGPVEYAWSGQILEPVDALGFAGSDPGGMENVYVVSGDSGNGLTHGTLAGEVLAALICGRQAPWENVYDPHRRTPQTVGTWIQENANVAVQYRDWLRPAGDAPPDRGEGAIVRHGAELVALYRADDDRLHAFSSRCPHLGCSVRWNSAERSWDCPCHGSRFDPCSGRVLNGPAANGLEAVDIDPA